VSSSAKKKKLLSPDPSQMVIRIVLRVPLLTRIFHSGYSSLETSPLSQTKPKRREEFAKNRGRKLSLFARYEKEKQERGNSH
jgi:hypothetical protein